MEASTISAFRGFMAVWLLRRAGIVLTLFFRISYCEFDLLENLQPRINDPPELTDFLKSVLHKKDEFKKIREAAKHLQLHPSSIDEDVFSNDHVESRGKVKTRLSKLSHLSRYFKHPPYHTGNKHHPLNRRSGNSERPINDVYPYMYDDNESEEPDEREERSSWKDIKERIKHNNQRNRKRYRRGLDLTDYSSDKDFVLGNIKVFPRSKSGYRIVPGNKYQQRRDISTHFNNRVTKRRLNFLKGTVSKKKSISQILGSSPFTERAIPDDFSAEHDILGFKAESLSESNISQKNNELHNDNIPSEDNTVSKLNANSFQEIHPNLDANKLLFNGNMIDHTKTETTNEGGRRKRSMKLNIIDDNNLIKRITQDISAKSVILTIGNDKTLQEKQHLQRKTITTPSPVIDFESLHKALHFGEPYLKIHENPSNAIDISKSQEILPDILIQLDKPNEKQDSKQILNLIKPNESNILPLIYNLDVDKTNEIVDQAPEQKKIMLQDVDEPTSAIEQYELSTKPYIIAVPRSGNVFSSFDVPKQVTGFLDPVDTTTNKRNQFIVKETKDMVHGKNKKTLLFVEKKSVTDKVKEQENETMPTSQKLKRSNDYDAAINNLRNKLDSYSEVFDNDDSNPENQLIKELSRIKRDTSKSGKNMANLEYTQNNDYYYQDQNEMEPQMSFRGRKLKSFDESDTDRILESNDEIPQNTRYGYLDYENGKRNHMREPGFTENKIRVKRDLTDLFGMSNDEDYSEDLLDDYNPSVKQERSDYTYEEEGDLAVPEKQSYANKKKNKNKVQNKHQNVENGDNDTSTTQTYSSITTESPITCDSSKQTSKMSETKGGKKVDKLNNHEFNKEVVNTNDNMNLNPESNHNTGNAENGIQPDIRCSNCKKTNAKNEKCNNCKMNIGSGDDKNCKSCNRKTRSANNNEQKQFRSSTILYSDNLEKVTDSEALNNEYADTKEQRKNFENGFISNIKIRSNNQTNSTMLGDSADGCEKNNTFHSKTVSNNTSSDENKKPPTEEASSDQVEYKFGNHANNTNNEQACSNKSQTNGPPLEHNNNKKMYSETEPEEYLPYENDYGETVGFAHHPLKTKNAHKERGNNNKCGSDCKNTVGDALTRFHTKHNQNEFNQISQNPEHEESPDLDTTADRNEEANFEELFRDNHNQISQQSSPVDSELKNNNVEANMRQESEKQIPAAETNEDENEAEFSLLAESFRNNKIKEQKSIEKNQFENNDDEGSSSQANKFKRNSNTETAGKRNTETDKMQGYGESSKSGNIVRNARKKKYANSLLLNSVDNFADIVEETINNKKVNKRQTHAQKRWSKPDASNKIKGRDGENLHIVEPVNRYTDEAPFETFSKLNQGYWKKHSARLIRRPSYPRVPYNKDSSFYEKEYNGNIPSSVATNFNQDSNYANRHNNIASRRRLHFMNNNNLRRIRRDKFSKISETKTGRDNLKKNSEGQEIENAITNMIERKPRHRGEGHDAHCAQDKQKTGIKEWLSPKGAKTKQKQCLLSEYTGLNPSFGVKPSKGSCNDEAEVDKGSKDYGQLHDALNGHLASLVVQTTFKRIKEHQQLKNRFSHGLSRKHGFKSEMKDLNAFRNNETEGDVKHTEEMLHQIMTVLNKIILDQVRRRTCKHLSPELQKYLASITKSTKKAVEDEDAKISEEGFPLPLVKGGKHKENQIDTEQGDFLFNNPGNKPELEADEEEIKKKMKMIKELLDKYKHMSNRCRIKVEDVEAYLKKHLCMLKQLLQEIKQNKGGACKEGKSEGPNVPNKLKRKNYDLPPVFDVKQPDYSHYNVYTKNDLINKQLDSIGLGPSRTYKPAFNLDQLIEDAKYKIKYKSLKDSSSRSSKNPAVNSKSNYRNEDDTFEQLEEDYENPKNERKREIIENEKKNRRLVSEKYRKLVQAVESLRKKRASAERLGKLFGQPEKRSVRNENYETIKSLNKKYQDYSHVGFETPVVFSLKK